MEEWYFLIRRPFHDLDTTVQKLVYDSYYQFVYRDINLILHDHALVEDVIQNAFIKLISKGPTLCSDNNLPAWIKLVTRNTALDYLKKIKKERILIRKSLIKIRNDEFSEISVTSEVESKWRNEMLHEAITELKISYQILIYLYYLEYKSYKEICQELHITEGALAKRMARARKKLLQIFLDKCGKQ
ncbi:sigma-70 family RNA polymerase sigma factor [Paenibacillus oralis]|uniref:Sigma-70 family RNA polymerase sigma factor n=1 Tax=Paenibacillus oralis TaxID=2490856 RepID=A0A3P3U4A2_9BACL|nr:sigma-70 family RNA polymerase sigma factor [Paenibacillus oralis]RRJ64990.1 sigma-70 family RNA polymerase sigma factor [Paenibacillus oralis]